MNDSDSDTFMGHPVLSESGTAVTNAVSGLRCLKYQDLFFW